MYNTELRICDLKDVIHQMCPVKIVLNNKEEIFNDDKTSPENYQEVLNEYNKFLESKKLVTSIKFDIVHFHHSIVYIETL